MTREEKVSVIKTVIENWGTCVPSKFRIPNIVIEVDNKQKKSIDCLWKNDVLINTYENGFIINYEHVKYEDLEDDVLDECYDVIQDFESLLLWAVDDYYNEFQVII